MRTNLAFSLTELMITIAIIGLLAAMVMPSYKAYMVKAQIGSFMPLADAMMKEATLFYSVNGSFPDNNQIQTIPINDNDGLADEERILSWWTTELTGCNEASGSNGDFRGDYAIRFRFNNWVIPGANIPDLCFSATESNDTLTWVCTTPSSGTPNQSIPQNYLPESCKYPG